VNFGDWITVIRLDWPQSEYRCNLPTVTDFRICSTNLNASTPSVIYYAREVPTLRLEKVPAYPAAAAMMLTTDFSASEGGV